MQVYISTICNDEVKIKTDYVAFKYKTGENHEDGNSQNNLEHGALQHYGKLTCQIYYHSKSMYCVLSHIV